MPALHAVPSPDRPSDEGVPPPHDLPAEAAVLSATLFDPEAYSRISSLVTHEHFFSGTNARIFQAVAGVAGAGGAIDTVTVASWLKDRGWLEAVGGINALTEILDACPAISNLPSHAEIIFEKWRARRALTICQWATARAYADYGDTQEFILGVVRQLSEVACRTPRSRIESNVEAIRSIIRDSETARTQDATGKRRTVGIKTGLWGYDAMTFGLHSGEKTTVAARTGVGKTAFALQVARHVAAQKIGVLFFSTEMTREELLRRAMSAESRIPGQRVKEGALADAEWTRLFAAGKTISSLPILIDETSALTADDIRARALAHFERPTFEGGVPLGLIVVDYVQRLEPSAEVARKERHEQIAHSTKMLKRLAQELKIPVLELAQEKDSEIDKITKLRPKPDTGWTADCKKIGKESDVMIFLRRDPLKNAEGKIIGEDKKNLTLILDKQRNGDTGEIQLRFKPEISTFEYVMPMGCES